MPIQLRFKWKETHHPPYGQRNKSYLTCSFTQCRTKLLAHRETQKPELKYKRGSQLTGLLQAQAQHRTQLPIILNMQEYHTASIFPFHTEIHANLTSAKTLLCVSRSQMFTNVLNKNQHLWEQTFRNPIHSSVQNPWGDVVENLDKQHKNNHNTTRLQRRRLTHDLRNKIPPEQQCILKNYRRIYYYYNHSKKIVKIQDTYRHQ